MVRSCTIYAVILNLLSFRPIFGQSNETFYLTPVLEGQQVQLNCTLPDIIYAITDDQIDTLKGYWSLPGGEVLKFGSSSDSNRRQSYPNGSLVVDNIRKDDIGTYQCFADIDTTGGEIGSEAMEEGDINMARLLNSTEAATNSSLIQQISKSESFATDESTKKFHHLQKMSKNETLATQRHIIPYLITRKNYPKSFAVAAGSAAGFLLIVMVLYILNRWNYDSRHPQQEGNVTISVATSLDHVDLDSSTGGSLRRRNNRVGPITEEPINVTTIRFGDDDNDNDYQLNTVQYARLQHPIDGQQRSHRGEASNGITSAVIHTSL